MTISKFVDKLQTELIDRGFVVQRYDAYSTNSCYLKIDYGICNSIRISDHSGKAKYDFRYNVLMDISERYTEQNQFYSEFFPPEMISELITSIENNRLKKQEMYGINYGYEMEKARTKNQGKRGFWKQAYLATRIGE